MARKKIKTSDLVIRHAEPSDLKGIKAIFEQENAYSNTLMVPYASDALWEKRLADLSDEHILLVGVLGDEIVGQLTLSTFDRPRRKHAATFGMAVSDAHTGKGIGSRLLEAALDLADNWLNVRRVELEVFADNAAAIGLYKKFGFEAEGTCRQHSFRKGTYVDTLIMARLRDC